MTYFIAVIALILAFSVTAKGDPLGGDRPERIVATGLLVWAVVLLVLQAQ